MGRRRIRIEGDRPAERGDRLLGAALHHGRVGERDVPPRVTVVEGDRPNGLLTPRAQARLAVDPAHVRGKHVAETHQASSRRVVGIGFDGALQRLDSRRAVLARQAPEVRLRAGDQLPGAQVVGRTRKGADAFGRQQVGLDSRGDIAGDVVLHGEDVAEPSVVALRPVMRSRDGVDQLGADAQPIAVAAHAAFEHVTDAELARNLAHIDCAVLVDEGGVAGDDEQPSDLGKTSDEVLREAVSEVVLVGVPAHVGEGQHRDRRTARQRQTARCRRAHVRAGGLVLTDFGDEPQTLARQRLDQSLLAAGVADGAAGRIDPVEQRGLRDDATVPDRGHQLIFANHTVAVADQVSQEIEDLGLDCYQGRSPAQLAAIRVEYTIFE